MLEQPIPLELLSFVIEHDLVLNDQLTEPGPLDGHLARRSTGPSGCHPVISGTHEVRHFLEQRHEGAVLHAGRRSGSTLNRAEKLLGLLLLVAIAASVLNYAYFRLRLGAVMAPARANPAIALTQGPTIRAQLTGERNALVYREVFIVLAAGLGVVLLWRRDNTS